MNTSNQKSLADSTLSALRWDYTGRAARAISSLVIGIVLARLLGPEPFGLVAVAWLAIGFGNLVADLGMGSALVQRQDICQQDIRYVFTIQVLTGMSLTALLVLSGPLIARFFDQPKLVPVLYALSVVFLIHAFGTTAASLLRRKLDFKKVQFATVCSYLVGFGMLGIPLALLGFEVWSLVIAQLSQATLFSALCYAQVRHQVTPLFRTSSSYGLFNFGSKVLLSNIVNWTISNIDTFFIGRFFDVVILGLYSRAYVLVTKPMHDVVVTMQRVMFSAYSRVQHDVQTVRKVYLACVEFISVLMLPCFGCMALVPATVIYGLFGDEWRGAIPVLVPLALAMPFHAVMAMGGPMLWAQNQVGREFRAQLSTALVFIVVLFATSRISVTAVAWGVLGMSIFRFVLVTHASLKTLDASWASLIRLMSGGMFLLIPTAGAVFLVDHVMTTFHTAASLQLAVDVLVGAGVLLGVALIAPRMVFSLGMHMLADRLTPRMPVRIRPLMKRIFSPA